jgi:hypothetical protein
MWTQCNTLSWQRNRRKRVTTAIYDARNARQRDDNAKRTAGRSSLSPFFYICGAACIAALQSMSLVFFTLFLTKTWASTETGRSGA